MAATGKANVSKSTDKEETKENLSKFKKIMPEPLPLLPKVTTVFEVPPKCPIESIKFI